MGQLKPSSFGVFMAVAALLAVPFTTGSSSPQNVATAEVILQRLDVDMRKGGQDFQKQEHGVARAVTLRPSRGSYQRQRVDKPSSNAQGRADAPDRPSWLPRWLRRCGVARVDAARSHRNGSVPSAELCRLPNSGHLLHPDAALRWWLLSRRFKGRFGVKPCVSDSYRSYQAQAQVYDAKPGLAARPGTSNHGWGVALDLCGGIESYTSRRHQWLRRSGRQLGWQNPTWARSTGSRPEPWHWEFRRTPQAESRGNR